MRKNVDETAAVLVFCDEYRVRVEAGGKIWEDSILDIDGQKFAQRVNKFIEGLLAEGVFGNTKAES